MLRSNTLFICVFLAISLAACGPSAPEPVETALPQVTLPGTEIQTFRSASTGRDYALYLRLPDNYEQGSQEYPVLYLLDGQWDFKLLDSIYGNLRYDQFVPEMLIVGITYAGENPDYGTLRGIDYTPKGDPSGAGGGAPDFLAFFKEELIPFIETNYRADPARRVLMGSSFGGSFTLYALFADPDLFWGYVAASPAVPFGNWAVFKQEAEYASQRDDLLARLFLTVGELEELNQPVKDMMETIQGRNYTGLEMETMVIAGERHASNKPEAYNRGLRYIFQGK